jgi:hypothetical protein
MDFQIYSLPVRKQYKMLVVDVFKSLCQQPSLSINHGNHAPSYLYVEFTNVRIYRIIIMCNKYYPITKLLSVFLRPNQIYQIKSYPGMF